MDTKTAVENSIWPYLFGVVCHEAYKPEDPDERLNDLYHAFERYLIAWTEQIPKHSHSTMRKYLKLVTNDMISLCHDKQACEGRGGNSTTKTVGVFKGIMENVPLVKIEGFEEFEKACADLDALVYSYLDEEYDAQFDSGKIHKKVIKGINILKGMGYYGTV